MRLVAGLSLALLAGTSYAQDSALLKKMDGMSGLCFLTARSGDGAVLEAKRLHGAKSNQYLEASRSRAEKNRKCVEKARADIKEPYRAQLQSTPQLRQQVMDAYTNWLAYLDHMAGQDSDRYQLAYEDAARQLKAELDAL